MYYSFDVCVCVCIYIVALGRDYSRGRVFISQTIQDSDGAD